MVVGDGDVARVVDPAEKAAPGAAGVAALSAGAAGS